MAKPSDRSPVRKLRFNVDHGSVALETQLRRLEEFMLDYFDTILAPQANPSATRSFQ